jgi:hypothetical protein
MMFRNNWLNKLVLVLACLMCSTATSDSYDWRDDADGAVCSLAYGVNFAGNEATEYLAND